MSRVYMDNSATTPMHAQVYEAMKPYFIEKFGNPSSLYAAGREARKAVEEAREKAAKAIGAKPDEIIFTSGGTESDNLAIRGVVRALRKKGNHIITSAIEHHAVLDTCVALKEDGYKITILPVDKYGKVSLEDLEQAITDDTILISVMMANNEVGTIQPVAAIGKIAKARGIVFHTDAVQAIGNLPVNVDDLHCDLLSLSAHKFYGPKGMGILFVRKGTKIKPSNFGGMQERKMRPGTENVPGIVGTGAAVELASENMQENVKKVRALRDRLIEGLLQINHVHLNGHPIERLPGNINVSVQFVEGESLILSLDLKGIAISSGSACTSGSLDPSHVLLAMGLDHQSAHGSLRFSLGHLNTDEEISYVLEIMPEIVTRLRSMSPVYTG